jgi:hypothetical protein
MTVPLGALKSSLIKIESTVQQQQQQHPAMYHQAYE